MIDDHAKTAEIERCKLIVSVARYTEEIEDQWQSWPRQLSGGLRELLKDGLLETGWYGFDETEHIFVTAGGKEFVEAHDPDAPTYRWYKDFDGFMMYD